MKHNGILCGVSGVTAVLLVLAGLAGWSGPVGAQPETSAHALGEPSMVSSLSPLPLQPPAPKKPKPQNIDDLIHKLSEIKAQKAALDRAEKDTVNLLKRKLKEQRERLQKLGVDVEENLSPVPAGTTIPGPATVPGDARPLTGSLSKPPTPAPVMPASSLAPPAPAR